MLLEFRVERGKVTPLHLHPNEDEGFYVLEGEEHRIGQGSVFIRPRGFPSCVHGHLRVPPPARLATPGTGEAIYREVTEPIRSAEDVSRPPDWARLRATAERSPSIELLGPPPFAAAQQEAAAAPA